MVELLAPARSSAAFSGATLGTITLSDSLFPPADTQAELSWRDNPLPFAESDLGLLRAIVKLSASRFSKIDTIRAGF
jgi:hypothetical protein